MTIINEERNYQELKGEVLKWWIEVMQKNQSY